MSMADSLAELQRRDPALAFRVDPELKTIRHLRGKLGKARKRTESMRDAGIQFVEEHPELFGPIELDRTVVLEKTADPQGGRSLTLQQYHGPHLVYGGSLRLHVNDEGVLDTISSRLFPDLASVPKEPEIDAEQAIDIAMRGAKSRVRPETPPEPVVFRHKGKPYLAWRVELQDTKQGERGAPAQWIAFIDATTGKLLVLYDNVQTAGPVSGSGTGYYSGSGAINAWFNDVTYQLRDTTRTSTGGPEIITNDEDGASPSEDADDNWSDTTSAPRHSHQGPEVDAHRYAAQVVDYFRTVHSRNSYNGTGGDVITTVHVGTDFSNGYWSPAAQRVYLGDGAGAAPGDDYECSDDWLAHEFTHGYTQFTCALQYLNESGALNEALSDCFAAFVTGDWLVFEDSWLNATAPAWRNMLDPTNGGQWNAADPITSVLAGHQPSHYSVRYTGVADNGGVHINSGIINHLVYLLTVGGTHTVSGISVSGIGQTAVEQMLWRCMTVNLVGNPTADFLDFREAMLDACLDLFPIDLNKLTQVKNAFNAVGVGPDIYVRDNIADTGLEPYPGGYLWASPDIINRQATSANPAVDFADLSNDALWENVEAGQDNYVYVRLQNRGPQVGDAAVNVYFSSASTFGTPASWIHIGTLSATGMNPGSLSILGPLTFPAGLIPAPGHYCMIAVLTSTLDPAPNHTLIASVSDYLNFVRHTNNIGYRNMDVVDIVPGTMGTMAATVRTLEGIPERYALRIDLGRFVPDARIRVRGPAKALDGAIPRGLKLVARANGENVYEPIAGRELPRHLAFMGLRPQLPDPAPGFDDVLVDNEFELQIDYLVPEKVRLRGAADGYRLAVRQVWNDEEVGVVAIRTQPQRARRKPPARRRAPRKMQT